MVVRLDQSLFNVGTRSRVEGFRFGELQMAWSDRSCLWVSPSMGHDTRPGNVPKFCEIRIYAIWTVSGKAARCRRQKQGDIHSTAANPGRLIMRPLAKQAIAC